MMIGCYYSIDYWLFNFDIDYFFTLISRSLFYIVLLNIDY